MGYRPVPFSGAMLARAADALRESLRSQPLDLIATSRRMLEAAIRHDRDAIELLPNPNPDGAGRKPKHHLEHVT